MFIVDTYFDNSASKMLTQRIKKLFLAKNLIEACVPSFKLGHFLGIGIYTWKLENDKVVIKISKFWAIYSVIVLLLYLWASIIAMYCRETMIGFMYRSKIYTYYEFLEVLFGCILIFSFVLPLYLPCRNAPSLIFSIQRIDQRLLALGEKFNYSRLKFILIMKLIMHATLSHLRFFGLYLPFFYWNIYAPKYKIASTMFTIMICDILISRFYFILFIISQRYNRLNNVLRNIHGTDNTYKVKSVEMTTTCEEGVKMTDFLLKDVIKELYDLYIKLSRISNTIIKRVAIQIVIMVLLSFFLVIFNMFHAIHVLSTGKITNTERLAFFIIYIVLQVTGGLLSVTAITYSCSRTVAEANKTQFIICKIINMDLNDEVIRKAEQFSMMIPHHIPKFTACGLFKLNYPFILTFMGSIASYLIILLQLASGSINDIGLPSNSSLFNSVSMC